MLQKVPPLRSESLLPADTSTSLHKPLTARQESHQHLIAQPLQAPKLVNSSNTELNCTRTADGKANVPYAFIGYSHGAGILRVFIAEWK